MTTTFGPGSPLPYRQEKRKKMFRISWAITLAFTIALLTGILIVTRDLGISNDIFKDGVVQAQTVDATTDDALAGAAELVPANAAIDQGLPQVVGVLDSLVRANETLGSLGTNLDQLGTALQAADAPLVGIIEAGEGATVQANAATVPAARIVDTLGAANEKVAVMGPMLDESLALSKEIDSKLRIALLLPKIGE